MVVIQVVLLGGLVTGVAGKIPRQQLTGRVLIQTHAVTVTAMIFTVVFVVLHQHLSFFSPWSFFLLGASASFGAFGCGSFAGASSVGVVVVVLGLNVFLFAVVECILFFSFASFLFFLLLCLCQQYLQLLFAVAVDPLQVFPFLLLSLFTNVLFSFLFDPVSCLFFLFQAGDVIDR